ncbi:hypothetical protein E1218_06945 [Kribbella turkmenica]|uniref:Uncharacterized protein n=1 Tax=Kribbella turkmenica TaxID=2530375 RepID=A0A4R4XCT8_9ACTN|nr:hypothetical protein E1218_06945 [Kribbella turkmenica]
MRRRDEPSLWRPEVRPHRVRPGLGRDCRHGGGGRHPEPSRRSAGRELRRHRPQGDGLRLRRPGGRLV